MDGALRPNVVNPATGFMSSNDPAVHIGLGRAKLIDELAVVWPDGHRQVFNRLAANKHYRITRSEKAAPTKTAAKKDPLFAVRENFVGAPHKEKPFDDFAVQPLLPNKLSQLGPGLAVGDLDGDGKDDFVVGSGSGEQPRVQLRNGGKLVWGWFKTGAPDAECEDMAPLLFDADGDGDLDWYAVSGGVEQGENTALLRDRLYVNISPGNYKKAAEGSMPDFQYSGSVAAAAEYDRDGDLDLFVGSRVLPGQYPLSSPSVLLRNDSETPNEPRFAEVTGDVAPGLREAGMVTSALWSDANGDGWVDLLVTTEWGPIRTYLNRKGKLEDATEASGLAGKTGWWNGLAARDFDNDGDMDYVATNFGLNTKYEPSEKKPSRIYYGTFGDEKEPHLIEAKVVGNQILPVRGKSCSQNAMPFVQRKFATFHSFASASLVDIYSDSALSKATLFEVNTLTSSVLLNDGKGRFKLQSL
ncbi:MAG: FG-GAP-like repeat-containing protein, partial [Verrucomicrobiota bacterium]